VNACVPAFTHTLLMIWVPVAVNVNGAASTLVPPGSHEAVARAGSSVLLLEALAPATAAEGAEGAGACELQDAAMNGRSKADAEATATASRRHGSERVVISLSTLSAAVVIS
jgi:hypothetical protein